MRNEKILQLIAYYLSIDGNINYLYDELIKTNCIIDELFSNFILNNIYIVIYDKNLTPNQMIDNFKNFDINKINDIQSKEQEISNLKYYIQKLNKRKEEIHKKFVSICKDKYDIKNKYNSINNRNKNNISNEIDMDLNILNNTNGINTKEEINNEKILKSKKNKNEYTSKNNSKNNNKNNIKNNSRKNTKTKGIINEDKNIKKIINKNVNSISNEYGIKTRKKNKVDYFKDNYHKNRKSFKKIFRKKKTILTGKTRDYYLHNNNKS